VISVPEASTTANVSVGLAAVALEAGALAAGDGDPLGVPALPPPPPQAVRVMAIARLITYFSKFIFIFL
jgi:hypothetical protein